MPPRRCCLSQTARTQTFCTLHYITQSLTLACSCSLARSLSLCLSHSQRRDKGATWNSSLLGSENSPKFVCVRVQYIYIQSTKHNARETKQIAHTHTKNAFRKAHMHEHARGTTTLPPLRAQKQKKYNVTSILSSRSPTRAQSLLHARRARAKATTQCTPQSAQACVDGVLV